jgi:hypothetical protein
MQPFKILLLIIFLPIIAACKKHPEKESMATPVVAGPVEAPKMTYFDLSGKSIVLNQSKSLSVDVNGDGRSDVYFYYQLLASDVDNWVKYQLIAGSPLTTTMAYGMTQAGEDTLKELRKGDTFPLGDWYNGSEAVIIQKVENTLTNTIHWEGNWADKGHLYLPFKVLKGGLTYHGWIELEAITAEGKIIIYNAALCQEAGVSVKAGI